MKIAFTADAHLRSHDEYPERYTALTNVLEQCRQQKITHLVIAGDLFDKTLQNYSDFETICQHDDFSSIDVHIIPGNHDPNIQQEHFSSGNIHVYSDAQWVDFGADWSILFIPYLAEKSMGEVIEKQIEKRPSSKKWVLVGHGDYSAGMRISNPYEPGVYMPLTQRDITIYKPDCVFLGHIHLPLGFSNLHYPGSPCGLDITETGYRRFLVLDTETKQVKSHRIQTDVIYFIERLIILPAEDETKFIKNEIQNSIRGWGLNKADRDRAIVRVICKGYSSNKAELKKTIKNAFKHFRLESEPDLSDVFIANDPERDYLMERVRQKVNELDWGRLPEDPGKDEILLQALHYIYQER